MEKKYRILLAEDEAKLAKAIQAELTRVGYEVDVADNGLQADKMFMENDYSMALLDINLPGKNGMALCSDFRKRSANMPIVMLTAVGKFMIKLLHLILGQTII